MKKALIVCKNSLFSFAIHTFIEKYCFKVIGHVKDHKTLYEYIALRPDVVILECTIPIIEGIEILKEIKKKDRNIRVVMIVTKDEISNVSEAIKAGVEAILIN